MAVMLIRITPFVFETFGEGREVHNVENSGHSVQSDQPRARRLPERSA
jgi:hypothetical protein